MADTLKKQRARLYMHYKLNQVATEELVRLSHMTAEANYKRLCGIRIRLMHCLNARRAVHELYGDGEHGHAEAIAYVASQVALTDDLLREVCNEMIAVAAPVTQTKVEVEQAAATATEEKKKAAGKQKARRRNVKGCVEDLCQKLRVESETLETIAKQSLDKFCDVLMRMVDISMKDVDISSDMRCLVKDTFKRDAYETLNMFAGITMLIIYDANIPAGQTLSGRCLQSYFYYNDVTDDTLKQAIIKFQDKYLVRKRHLIETLEEAKTRDLDCVYLAYLQKLSVKLFAHLYSLTGPYTTRRSLSTVIILAGGVSKMSSKRFELCEPSDDARRRRFLVKKYGEAYVKDVEDATHMMLNLCDEADAWHPTLLPWTYFLNAKDLYVATTHAYAQYILKRTERQLFDITRL